MAQKSIAIQKRIHDKRNGKISYGKFHSYWPARDEWKNWSKSEYKRKATAIKELDYNRILCLFDVFFFYFNAFSVVPIIVAIVCFILFFSIWRFFDRFNVLLSCFFSSLFCFLIFKPPHPLNNSQQKWWIRIEAHKIYRTPLIRLNIQRAHVGLPFNSR